MQVLALTSLCKWQVNRMQHFKLGYRVPVNVNDCETVVLVQLLPQTTRTVSLLSLLTTWRFTKKWAQSVISPRWVLPMMMMRCVC